MDFLSVLGGVGRGINQGFDEISKRNAEDFLQKQRDAWTKEQDENADMQARLKGIQANAAQGYKLTNAPNPDYGPESAGAGIQVTPSQQIKTPYSSADAMRDSAAVLGSNLRFLPQAAQLRQLANSQEDRQRAMTALDNSRKLHELWKTDPIAFANGPMREHYNTIDNNHGFMLTPATHPAKGEGAYVHQTDGQGNVIGPEQFLTKSQIAAIGQGYMQAAAAHELGLSTPENFWRFSNLGVEQGKLGVAKQTADQTGTYQAGMLDHLLRADQTERDKLNLTRAEIAARTALLTRPELSVVATDDDGMPVFMDKRAADPKKVLFRQDGTPVTNPKIFQKLIGNDVDSYINSTVAKMAAAGEPVSPMFVANLRAVLDPKAAQNMAKSIRDNAMKDKKPEPAKKGIEAPKRNPSIGTIEPIVPGYNEAYGTD